VLISIGILAIGLLMFTLLAKAALPIQCEFLRTSPENIEQGKTCDIDESPNQNVVK
jgi:hypothetical protein